MQRTTLIGPFKKLTNSGGLLAILITIALIPILAVGVYFPPYYELFEHTAFRALLILGLELAFGVLALGAVGGVNAIFKILSPTLWTLIAGLVALAFSLAFFYPENSVPTILRTVFWIGHLMFGLALYALLRRLDPRQVFVLVASPIVVLVLLYDIFLLSYYSYAGPPSGESCVVVAPGFGNIRHPGYFTSAGLGLLIAFVALSNAKLALKFAAFAVATIFGIFIFYTGTRGAVMSFIAAGIALTFILPPAKSARLWAIFVGVATISALVTYVVPSADCKSFDIVRRLLQADETTDLGSGRLELIRVTIELIKEHPWFGRGEFLMWQLPNIEVSQPHNGPLQTLLTWGIIGSLIFWFLLVKLVLKLFFGARGSTPEAQCLVFAMLLQLAYSNLDPTLYYSLPLLILAMLSAGAAAIIFRPQETSS